MSSNDEFLIAFGTAFGHWSDSAERVELTADFGAPGGRGERQHENAKTVHSENTAKLTHLFTDADARGLGEVDLAAAASISPLEMRTARAQLG